jgi:RHS repeat-associated protein
LLAHFVEILAYKYHKQNGTARLRRNRLYQLFDDADPLNAEANESTDGSEDIGYLPETTFDEEVAELNGLHNYHYDALGNLIHDEREQIQSIQWTVAGKVKSVSRTTGSTRKPLSFAYGASGQRILKTVSDPDLDVTGSREHYIRDAQGHIMATYRYTNPGSASLQLNDRPLYGSARLGTLGEEMELHSLLNWDPADPVVVDQVDLNYELTDHLGNVCTVVTGRLLDGNGGGTLKQAELMSAQGYEPFGALLPGRKYEAQRARPVIFLPSVLTAGQSVTMTIGGGAPITLVSYTPGWTLAQYLAAICTALGTNGITAVSYPAQNQVRIDNWPTNAVLTSSLPFAEMRWDSYRFGYNGMEADNEMFGSLGTAYDFGARMYDSRLSRFFAIDPLTNSTPDESPFAYAGNSPIYYIDREGLGKDPAPGLVDKMVQQVWPEMYAAFIAANNTSPKNLNDWARGRSANGNSIKGAIGEGLWYKQLKNSSAGNPMRQVFFGRELYGDKFTSISQIDVAEIVITNNRSIFGIRTDNSYVMGNYSFNGTHGTHTLSSNRDQTDGWLVNYEVKTFSAQSSTDQLFEGLVGGMEKAILIGGTKTDKLVGVLVTDRDAWMKVAGDPKYKAQFKAVYDRLQASGNVLQLSQGFSNGADGVQQQLKMDINAVPE